MLIIGEVINTSNKIVNRAVHEKDAAAIQDLAQRQVDAGASYLDVNCGTMGQEEAKAMEWLVGTIQDKVKVPLCIDSANPATLEAGAALAQFGQPIINSLSAQKERFEQGLSIALAHKARVIALCMDRVVPKSPEHRLEIADKLVVELTSAGIPEEDIFLDPLVLPIKTGDEAGRVLLETIYELRRNYPGVHLVCGLSNVSYGLPGRRKLNHMFLAQTMTMGADAYILDPLDKELMDYVVAAKALLGYDPFCTKFLMRNKTIV